MNERFAIEKNSLLKKLDSFRINIEQISYDDAFKCCQKYHGEDDPMGVAFHELFYSHLINMLYTKS